MLTSPQPAAPVSPPRPGDSTLMFGVDLAPMSIACMLWKRKLSILTVWILVTALAILVVKQIPAVYEASALIILDSQKIPEKYVSATVNSDVQDRFATISQQIFTSSQIRKLIEQFDLYAKERKTKYPEQIFERMRADIAISPQKSVTGSRPGAFQISYKGSNPTVVAQVVNQIANLYIEENLKTREVQAEGTSEFLNAQLATAKQKLDEVESAVSNYKVQHNGELPQQEPTLNGMLARLQVELETNREAINRTHTTKVNVEAALSTAEQTAAALTKFMNREPGAPRDASPLDERILRSSAEPVLTPPSAAESLRERLRAARSRYTEEHPEVKYLIVQLERAEAAERAEDPKPVKVAAETNPLPLARPQPSGPAPRDLVDLRQANDRISSLKSQLLLLDTEIENRKAEQKRILNDISANQARVNRLPLREQDMAQITRDYEIAKMHYRSLLDKKIAADMAADMERRQKAERFTIADPARVPTMPTTPNRPKLYGAGSILGLIIGLVYGIGREAHQGRMLGEWQLPAGVSVLGRLPQITYSKRRGGRRSSKRLFRRLIPMTSILVCLLAMAGLYAARSLS